MNKLLIVLTGLLLLTGSVYADGFNAVKTAGDLKVTAATAGNPFKVGNNNVILEISDKQGETVTDAEVGIYYFMPSMPAMNYNTSAELRGTKYVAVIKPTMPGAWDADINIMKGAGEAQKVTISFDAK